MSITISKHAKERYAERIMDRDSKTDIAVFIRDHDDKIQNDIEKMVEFGTLLYEGPTTKDPKKDAAVTINGSWVIIWDAKAMTVITLYCIDLGVGEDVNKAFIENAVQQIGTAQAEYEQTITRSGEYIQQFQEIIESSQAKLDIYKKLCRDLENQIAGYRQAIVGINADNALAKDKVRECVEILIGKQKF